MMLDGAQVLRLGRDLIVNIAHDNHRLAVDWLERHLADRATGGDGYRVHRVWRMADNHIDSMLLALHPGVLLARHEGLRDLLPAEFRSWKLIVAPPPSPGNFPVYDDGDLLLTSPYIDLNVLSLDPTTVLVNADCPELAKTLEAEGFTVVMVRHRHRRLFGGGFHCFTLDTVRDGDLRGLPRMTPRPTPRVLLLEAAGPESRAVAAAATAAGIELHAATTPRMHAAYGTQLRDLLAGVVFTDFTDPAGAVADLAAYAAGFDGVLTLHEFLTPIATRCAQRSACPATTPPPRPASATRSTWRRGSPSTRSPHPPPGSSPLPASLPSCSPPARPASRW
ncbi:hypothetical protein ACFY4C_39310 [Actinomadura viridis]|uniref:hypothetical protein n=1 Tax=Actinomadura viridis TaxID=58110 RepID=UPI00368B08B1